MKLIHFSGKEYEVGDCLGCYNKNVDDVVFETDNYVVSQDFELPINGFIIISSKRHLKSINEMNKEEKLELIELIDVVLKAAKEIKICNEFNVIWEEKEWSHFHVWLMPRHKWMLEKFGNPTKNIKGVFEYAKENMRTEENINNIYKSISALKNSLNKGKSK